MSAARVADDPIAHFGDGNLAVGELIQLLAAIGRRLAAFHLGESDRSQSTALIDGAGTPKLSSFIRVAMTGAP
jgi:hypothetical protein